MSPPPSVTIKSYVTSRTFQYLLLTSTPTICAQWLDSHAVESPHEHAVMIPPT